MCLLKFLWCFRDVLEQKKKLKKNRVLGCQYLNLGFSIKCFGSLELTENAKIDDIVSFVKNNRANNALEKK
jgi:hypothetical protein